MAYLRALLIATSLLLLCGCQEKNTLLNMDGTPIGASVFDYSSNYSGTASFVIDHKEFKGDWRVIKVFDEATAKRHRLTGSLSYQEYLLGNSPDQLKHGHAALQAQDGVELSCDFYFRITPRTGQCRLGGMPLEIVVGLDASLAENIAETQGAHHVRSITNQFN
jgi:hypothetical protein